MTHRIAILLCAGYGTRMGALTAETPKPLLPVADKPVLDYLLEQLLQLDGLEQVHIVSNSKYAEPFRVWAGGWNERTDLELTVHDDGSTNNDDRLGAVGDLDFVLRRIDPPTGALVAAGDNIYRFSLRPLWRAFTSGDRDWVLGLEETDLEKLRRTGVLELEPDDRVRRLHEKPTHPPSTWACPSLYCFQASALARVASYLAASSPGGGQAEQLPGGGQAEQLPRGGQAEQLPRGGQMDLGPRDEIGRFVAHLVPREALYAHKVSGERLHVGSPEAYRRADSVLRRENPNPMKDSM